MAEIAKEQEAAVAPADHATAQVGAGSFVALTLSGVETQRRAETETHSRLQLGCHVATHLEQRAWRAAMSWYAQHLD